MTSGSEYARDFYKTWPFAQKAVCLYVHSIAWKGATVWGFKPDETKGTPLLDISQEALCGVLPDWFIDGNTMVSIETGSTARLGPVKAGSGQFTLITLADSFGEEDGESLLRMACSNHPNIQKMEEVMRTGPNDMAEAMLKLRLDEARHGLFLPEWAYDAVQAAKANRWAVLNDLYDYYLHVNHLRRNLLGSMQASLQPWLEEHHSEYTVTDIAWNEEWHPREGHGGWVGVYWAFRECGLQLTHFGIEFPAWLREFQAAGLMSASHLEGWAKLGL